MKFYHRFSIQIQNWKAIVNEKMANFEANTICSLSSSPTIPRKNHSQKLICAFHLVATELFLYRLSDHEYHQYSRLLF